MTAPRLCHCPRCGRFELCAGPAAFEEWLASHDCWVPHLVERGWRAAVRRWWRGEM